MGLKDNTGSTPLHWAVKENSVIAANYLVAWAEQYIDARTDDGQTALHIAVTSSEDLNSPRLVRTLLIRGINKEIRDNNGRTAMDLIPYLESKKLQRDLEKIMNPKEGPCAFLQLTQPLKRTEKSRSMPIAFITMIDSVYIVLVLVHFPLWVQRRYWVYIDLFLGVFNVILWFATMNSDPGYIETTKSVNFLKLIQAMDPKNLCPDCFVIKTPRSFHCSTCH